MKRKKATKSIERNRQIVNLVAPQGLSFQSNTVSFSGFEGQGYGVLKYPSSLSIGWLSDITSLESTIVSVSINPVDETEFINALDRNINNMLGDIYDGKTSRRQRAEKAIEDAEKLMKQIDQDGKSVCEMGISYIVTSDDKNTLSRLSRRNRSVCAGKGIKIVRPLSRRQDGALRQCLPTYGVDPSVSQSINRVTPISTFVGGFPFSSSSFSDSSGNYFARAKDGSVIMLDLWQRGGDRTNSNVLVTGIQGLGKSTAVKSIALTEYKDGTRIIFIDPEGEYTELAQNLEGDVLYAGGGNARINPFQIQPVPEDDEGEENPIYAERDEKGKLKKGLGALAMHIKTLEIFISTYLGGLNPFQLALLKKTIIELYENFGITWDTDVNRLKAEDFPTFTDLYKLLEKKHERTDEKACAELLTLLYDCTYGADSFLWNGKTTIDTQNQCVVLNTADLINNSDNVKRAQYFFFFFWCWTQMSRDRREKVLLFCDEAYTLVDPKVPQALGFLRNAEKRDRKYESGIVLITHSVVDLLDMAVKMFGQALIDIPCYKLIFGTDGQNLLETKTLFNLTEAEEQLLSRKERGRALCFIGARRFEVEFKLPEYRLELMGSAGGR